MALAYCISWILFSCLLLKSVSTNSYYEEALSKGILFFEGQRSGKLPASKRVEWRGDSALSDGQLDNINLSGGYYDAGDNVKFGFPMAFSVSLLSWAAVEYGDELADAGEIGNLRSAIKWGTDFLLRAHRASSMTLYTQVGDGNSDHGCWERPEDMDTPRTLYKINSTSPGSEVAAEYAAALAAASIVFNRTNAKYSSRLLNHSKLLFEFADKYRGSYQGSCPFYCSYSGYQDELLWAAAWLYKATGGSRYLDYVSTNKGWSQTVSEFSWDNKFPGVQTLLAKEFLSGRKDDLWVYKNGADSFVCALLPGSDSRRITATPGGLLYTRDSSNMQYVTTASMVLLIYSDGLSAAGINTVRCGSFDFSISNIVALAKSQEDYILGDNPMNVSYMVGFTTKFPTHMHHRGASIPSIRSHPSKISCNEGFDWYSSSNPDPNIHIGAIVGGPDSNDGFSDSRSDYSHSEPTTYINAAFIGATAALIGRKNR